MELNEDVVKGSQVVLIQATDADESEAKATKIKFTLEGEGADHFIIDKESGIIYGVLCLSLFIPSFLHFFLTSASSIYFVSRHCLSLSAT